MAEVNLAGVRWFKSPFPEKGREVAFVGSSIAVRRDGGIPQIYELGEWRAFLEEVRSSQAGI